MTLLVTAACLVVALPLLGLALGYRTMVVAGGSMAPYAEAGDAIVLRTSSAVDALPGDVISFTPLGSKGIVTHRVLKRVDIEGTPYFQTQGDANGGPDANLVPAVNVLGRVALRVPDLGVFYWFATSVQGRIVLVVIPAVLLLWGEVRTLRRRRRAQTARAKRRKALAAVALSLGAVIGVGAPAAGLFLEASAVASNGFTASRVDAPNLTSATYSGGGLNCRITLNWSAPGTGLAPDGYDVYRSTTSGGPYSFIQHVGTVTTLQNSGLAISTTYHYVLRSSRSLWRSVNSNQRSASTPLLCL